MIAGHDHCEVDADGRCVTDGEGRHDDNEDCMVQVLVAGNLTIRGTALRVESCASCECDYVRIDDYSRMCGRILSGNTSSVRVDSVLQWHSDDSVTRAGWTLCLVPGPTAVTQGTSLNVAQHVICTITFGAHTGDSWAIDLRSKVLGCCFRVFQILR